MIAVVVFCSDFFFFKQKTAYEIRISDWSSDVCSSDLRSLQCYRRISFGASSCHRVAKDTADRRSQSTRRLVPTPRLHSSQDFQHLGHCNVPDWPAAELGIGE